MEQLSGLDAAFVYGETAGPAHVTFFAIYDPSTAPGGVLTFDDLVAHVGSRLGVASFFRSVLARVPFDLDHPYWLRDENFELGNHLHHWTLPEPGGWRQLCDEISRLHAQHLDLHRSPWECHVIDGLGEIRGVPEGAFAMCLKVHHSAVDGLTGLSVIMGLHDLTPETAPAPEDEWAPEAHPSSLNLLARTALTFARRPAQLATAARHTVPLLSKLPKAMTRRLPIGRGVEYLPDLEAPHSRFNGHTDSSRNFDGRSYDLASVKAVRALVPEATVNDVMIAGIGGALRRYLLKKDDLPEKSLITIMASSLHAGPVRRHGVNQIAVARVLLGTNIADPIARLKVVHESSAHAKAVVAALGDRMIEYAEFVPGTVVDTAIRVGMATHLGTLIEQQRIANTLVSTMRGPDFPIYLAGARMLAGYAFSPFSQGGGLYHNVISYCGQVIVSINGCPTVLPDIEHYGDCMDDSFAELLSAATTAP
ncbi:wax ester/triacylglycerol synthase family O-acyltransferase [Gordonia rhizosphera]|uniref:Diacylglycerol O-acyltransferase n=1 Tax=Gordonia rhizosphera NBRC 16068 TaxID=1108045 RepID=K6V619_9ACTN|nr:wax ester/triacylglycerol synthase family O-acyltransferase [Gordonia rhizosphera]GAB91708.1 hypothetical protein GORHZ_141_00830 [Gordonia rhizosphera NBRC 16068]